MIRKCNPTSVVANLNEIREYAQVHKENIHIRNIERLLEVIKRYYSTLLYYIDHSSDDNTLEINNRSYKLVISGHDETGKSVNKSLPEIGESLIRNVFQDLSKNINTKVFENLLSLLNEILSTPNIPFDQKLHIINHESEVSNNKWIDLIKTANPKIAKETLVLRREFILRFLSSNSLKSFGLLDSQENISSINKAYLAYTKAYLKTIINSNQFVEIFTYLQSELDSLKNMIEPNNVDQNLLFSNLLDHLISYNHLFHLFHWGQIRDIIEEYTTFLTMEAFDQLISETKFHPNDIEFTNLQIELAEPEFEIPSSEVNTIIHFTIPYNLNGDNFSHRFDDSTTVIFQKIECLYDDPVFSFLDSTDLQINGIPLTFLSDSLGNVNNSTLITIHINGIFHPDFDIIDGKAEYLDFSTKDAQHGGKYYPHKDFIIDVLMKIKVSNLLPFEIEKREINSRLISNYFVVFLNINNEIIHQKLYTITNFDSYLKIKDRYVEAVSKLSLDVDKSDFNDFFFNSKITTRKSFHEFCYTLLEMTLKRSIELGNLHKSLWINKNTGNMPVKELIAHPIFFNQLRYICEVKGVFIGREVFAANGSVDFHFFYTFNGMPFNVSVEVKNAHSQYLQHGITTQLPLYMKDIGNRQGIYFVLWYKCNHFPQPKEFNNIQLLFEFLEKIKPKKYNIHVMIIDCTPKASPSKKAANHPCHGRQ
ncbi:MAG: hypothetical protein QQN41_04755 [Nitrosopumilus sp.]